MLADGQMRSLKLKYEGQALGGVEKKRQGSQQRETRKSAKLKTGPTRQGPNPRAQA
jgi:hypothetical protein